MAKVRQAALQAVVRATESVVEEGTSLILDTPKSGKIYERRGIKHQASAPGEPPASDTGRLVQSGHAEYDTKAISGTAVWSAAHAEALEHGTQNMEPRPFARQALANKQDEINKDFAEEIAAVLK
ncbi:hypothetical protein EN781_00135 [Mesorhizobium sp. M4A.F.Ca.ET.090.04.2.1]|uniref:HK97-gp10 family putative phage morphogenesis protein n=1 Tax=Mesorhizobium sp. M4A.F.Ca.ET.090.04.2.1 TaxID=2496663 RepID=UPI000FCAF3D4|nr:HK97-gp10 family putative phage morphogenesis protein [Mesorhizobium sp. M4A.F.Ca.ET.090.04.2.1]RVC47580.1 hypothetical protein EN781_00135 [Mesorhizobium sp. M4A.F.Ca.ET.090.04.2.1]